MFAKNGFGVPHCSLTFCLVAIRMGGVTPDEALEAVRGLAGAGRVRLSKHARARMALRNVSRNDIMSALERATDCLAYEDGWRVSGPDLDGETLRCGVVIDDGVIVITVFGT